MTAVSQLIESIMDVPGEFLEVAMQGPIEALLVLIGAVFVILPSALLAYLALGAAVDLVKPGQTGTRHP